MELQKQAGPGIVINRVWYESETNQIKVDADEYKVKVSF